MADICSTVLSVLLDLYSLGQSAYNVPYDQEGYAPTHRVDPTWL